MIIEIIKNEKNFKFKIIYCENCIQHDYYYKK